MNDYKTRAYYDTNGQYHQETIVKKTIKKGISFGTCLAMVISYVTWKSVLWAIIHGLFGWLYVLYFLIKY